MPNTTNYEPYDPLVLFRKRLEELRIEQNLTYSELADKARISIGTLNKLRRDGLCTKRTRVLVASALGVSDSYLSGMSDDKANRAPWGKFMELLLWVGYSKDEIYEHRNDFWKLQNETLNFIEDKANEIIGADNA